MPNKELLSNHFSLCSKFAIERGVKLSRSSHGEKIRYPIKRDTKKNWVLGPVGSCVDFLATEMAMAGVMVRGLELMPLVPQLMRIAAVEIVKKRGSKAAEPFEKFLYQDMAFEGMSERLSVNDFALLNSHTLVALWSGFETCIEDTVVLALMNDQLTVNAVCAEIKIRGHTGGLLEERDARSAFRSLERKARQGKGLMDSYDWLLGLLDIKRNPCSDLGKSLAEVNALRNAIMHNAGITDQQTLNTAPSLTLAIGDEILLTRDNIHSYYDAVTTFVKELLSGVVKSRHIRSKEELDAGDV